MAVCRTAANALAVMRSTPVDLAVIGLTLTDMDGLDLLSLMNEEGLARKILVVTSRRDEWTRFHLRKTAISGFLDVSEADESDLEEALRCVMSGAVYHSPSWSRNQEVTSDEAETLVQILSVTELQVFSAIGDGSDDQKAAERLGLSPKTVHSHRQRIMRKLGVQTRTELMREAIQRGLIRFTEDTVVRPVHERLMGERRLRNRIRSIRE